MGTFNSEGFTRYVYAAKTNPCLLQNRVSDRSDSPLSVEEIIKELKECINHPEELNVAVKGIIKRFESQNKATRAYQGA